MKKNILKFLLFVWWIIFTIPNFVNWQIQLMVPTVGGQDDLVEQWSYIVKTNETELVDIINLL